MADTTDAPYYLLGHLFPREKIRALVDGETTPETRETVRRIVRAMSRGVETRKDPEGDSKPPG